MALSEINALRQAKRFDEALRAVEAEPALHRKNGRLWCVRGDLIQLSNDPVGLPLSEVEKSYLTAFELNPSDLEAIESLAYYYDAVADDPEKAKHFAAQYLRLTQKPSADMKAIVES